MNMTRHRANRFWPALALVIPLCLMAGCDGRTAARVKLHVRPSPSNVPTRLDIQAQIAGPQTGLRYKWFTISGGCDPQESDSPTTVFHFGESVTRDRVSVEVWRGERRIGQAEIDVKVDEDLARLVSERSPQVQIQITTIPPSEPGGPDTRANIAGTVSGEPATQLGDRGGGRRGLRRRRVRREQRENERDHPGTLHHATARTLRRRHRVFQPGWPGST